MTKRTILHRPFLWLEVKQDVDTLLYNMTDVIKAYNKHSWSKKQIEKYFENKSTKEYIKLLACKATNDGISNTPEKGGIKESPNDGILSSVIETRRGKYWGTRGNQHLLVDFMMRLSPEFKHMAIDFILTWQSLALWRNNIKEGYKAMAKAIWDSWNANYREEATMLNVLNTGSMSSWQRARYDWDQMQRMDDMQKSNATLILAWLDIGTRKNLLIKQYMQ